MLWNSKWCSFAWRKARYYILVMSEHKTDYIRTYTGLHAYPLEPVADEIRIEDIAHSLSMLCRANGHYSSFYSVGANCLNCYEEACARR